LNTLELFESFIDFEKKNKVFKLQTQSGVYWWDIARYSIYFELNNTLVRKFVPNQIKIDKKNPFTIVVAIIKDTSYIFKLLFSKKKYLFMLHSRSENKSKKNYDSISNAYLKNLPLEDIFHLEPSFYANTEHSYYQNIFLKIVKKLFKSKNYNISININKLLNERFGTTINFEALIQKDLNSYNIEYKYYKKLFEFIRPEYSFVVQNGIQKALFAAASDSKVKCIELQHGQISRFHIAYSYSTEIDYSHLNSFPKVLFTYSDFWNKVNYPVSEKISMGIENKTNVKNIIPTNDIAFVFANVYTDNLLSFVKELAPKFEHKIYIKLHSNQKNEIAIIKEELNSYSNVEVIYIERTMDEILSLVSSIIMIQSTTIYEALQKGRKVFLYKKQDYDSHSDLFENQNVYIIESIDEFLLNKDKAFIIKEQMIFFKPFNKNKFLSYIEEDK
jgi:hypothetical protein